MLVLGLVATSFMNADSRWLLATLSFCIGWSQSATL
jgi:hypothetical protein